MLVLAADLQARVPTVQTEAFCALWSRQMVTDNPFLWRIQRRSPTESRAWLHRVWLAASYAAISRCARSCSPS